MSNREWEEARSLQILDEVRDLAIEASELKLPVDEVARILSNLILVTREVGVEYARDVIKKGKVVKRAAR